MKTWILVASASKAYLHETNNLRTKPLIAINTFSHPESKEKNRNLVTDRPGHYSTNHAAKGAYEKEHPKAHEAEIFACELAKMLDKAKADNKFDQLIIVALSHFQGILTKHLHLKNDAVTHIDKNFVDLTKEELTERLQKMQASFAF